MSRVWLPLVMAAGCFAVACGDDRAPRDDAAAPRAAAGQARALGLTRKAPAGYRRVCERQARAAPRAARACPPLVPGGRLRVLYPGRAPARDPDAGGFSADFVSHSLDRLERRRIETNGGHWHYDAAWAPKLRRAVAGAVERPQDAGEPSSCRDRRVGPHELRACRVTPYELGGGLHGGHIAYLWSHAGVTYVISLHGYANEPRARAMMDAWASAVTAGP